MFLTSFKNNLDSVTLRVLFYIHLYTIRDMASPTTSHYQSIQHKKNIVQVKWCDSSIEALTP